jgi:hypothetical protein
MLFEIRHFSLKSLQILRPPTTGGEAQVWLALDTVTGTLPLDAQLKLKGAGHYQGAPFSFEASGKSLLAWRNRTQPWPLKISFHAGDAHVRFETVLVAPANQADLTGRFSLACSNIELLGLFFSVNLSEFGWLDLKGRFEAKDDGVNFNDLTGQVAALEESVFSGELRAQVYPHLFKSRSSAGV